MNKFNVNPINATFTLVHTTNLGPKVFWAFYIATNLNSPGYEIKVVKTVVPIGFL